MFPRLTKNGIGYVQSPLLAQCDFLAHAFCTRLGGTSRDDYQSLNMSFREGDEEFHVLANWDKLSAAFEIPLENFLVLNQVHADGIFVIPPHGDFYNSCDPLNYDAMVTRRENLAICIKTADCVPVFIVDKMKKIIAAVHAGWRGTASGITAKVVRMMVRQFGSLPSDLLAAIGPSIGPCCYEVDGQTARAFEHVPHARTFFAPAKRRDRLMLNLPEANRLQILDLGVPQDNIETSGWCTTCHPDVFFSHRGSGGITGRQINFLMIQGAPPCRALFVNDAVGSVH